MPNISVHTLQMYRRPRSYATRILGGLAAATLLVPAPIHAVSGARSLLWSQPRVLAAGVDFLALGYDRGLEIWTWEGGAPEYFGRAHERPVAGTWADGHQLVWSEGDGSLHLGTITAGVLTESWSLPLGGASAEITASPCFAAAGTAAARVEVVWRTPRGLQPVTWNFPGASGVAALAARDSTLAAGGGDRVYLVRVRPDTLVLLDSITTGAFIQDAQWVGDTLAMAFGFSGLKRVAAAGDRFSAMLETRVPKGSYGDLAVWEGAWCAVDLFGGMEIFARGGSLDPVSAVVFDGTLRATAARGHEVCVLTFETGFSVLNVFTPSSPYWSADYRRPGAVRALRHTSLGLLAAADFSGVHALGDTSDAWIMSHPYNVSDLHSDGVHVVLTTLLGGTALFPMAVGHPLEPVAIVRPGGYGRLARISGERLYTYRTPGCEDGFFVYDVSRPGFPREIASWSVCAIVRDMALIPGGLALALADSGIWVLPEPLSDSLPPMARTAAPASWQQVIWDGTQLWGRSDSGVIARWAWSGQALSELDRFPASGSVSFAVDGELLATADSSRRVNVWRWEPGGVLVARDVLRTDHIPGRVALAGDTVWVVDHDAVLRAVIDAPVDVDQPADQSIVPRSALLPPPYPNPFNGSLRIRVDLQPGDWRVEVHDLLGRAVASWSGRSGSGAVQYLIWRPGKPGRPAPSGVYVVSAVNGERSGTRKVVYLK